MSQEPTDRRRMTFGDYIDKVVVYVIAALVGWLCLSTTELQKQNATIIERQANSAEQTKIILNNQEGLRINDRLLQEQITKLKIQAATHGWRE